MSILNAVYVFTRRRRYQLSVDVSRDVASTNAHLVSRSTSAVGSPSVLDQALDAVLSWVGWKPNNLYGKVWELWVWDPPAFSLTVFW
jgi:hypothetical protein